MQFQIASRTLPWNVSELLQRCSRCQKMLAPSPAKSQAYAMSAWGVRASTGRYQLHALRERHLQRAHALPRLHQLPKKCSACSDASHPLVIKFQPALAVRLDVGVVVAAVDAAAVHEHAVQLVQVAHGAVRVLGQPLAVFQVQVQLVRELVPVIDLRMYRGIRESVWT